jgi:hypothetical protein
MKRYAILSHDDMIILTRNYTKEDDRDANSKYFYEKHTCPSNNFSDFEIMKLHQTPTPHLEADPHGIFKFNGIIDIDIEENEDINFSNDRTDWETIFAEILKQLTEESK